MIYCLLSSENSFCTKRPLQKSPDPVFIETNHHFLFDSCWNGIGSKLLKCKIYYCLLPFKKKKITEDFTSLFWDVVG